VKLDFIGSQQQGLSVAINNQVSENCYVVPAPEGRNGVALVGAPGTVLRSSISGACRGGHKNKKSGVAYMVYDTRLYRIESALTATLLGTIIGSTRVSIADNGTQVVIVTGAGLPGYIYNESTGVLSSITDPDFPGADTVTYLDGYFIFSASDAQWFICIVNDPTDYNALDFATNEKSPDDTLAVAEDHGEIFCFGTETIEVWFNSSNVDFPFERNGSAQIERGLYARFAVAKDDNTLFFLGNDLLVYRMQGYTPVVISDEGVNTELSNWLKAGAETDLRNAWAYTYTDHGHKFLVLTVPNRGTRVYDMATQKWHARKHFNYETHHSAAYVNAYGKHLIGGISGNLYEMTRDAFDDAGTPLRRLRRTKVYAEDGRKLRYKKLKLVMDTGNGLMSGQGSDPVLVVRWSDDNGHSWSNERLLGLGIQGDYQKQVITRHMGSARARLIEIYVTDPVKFFVADCYATVA
jgi:hypothetical protein